MDMFLNNRMNEAEEACLKENKPTYYSRLYVQTASALMQSMTALMSFEDGVCTIRPIAHFKDL
jgi:hypothetical protein